MENSLPTKTKIAAWWMVIIGGILGVLIILFIFLSFSQSHGGMTAADIFGFIIIALVSLISVIFFVPGILIMKRKKRAWWIGRILLWIEVIGISGFVFLSRHDPYFDTIIFGIIIFLDIIVIIPLLLFELDRKNFFKIAK